MLPSPIQLKDLSYLGFKVWPRQLSEEEASTKTTAGLEFDFNDVMIGESVEISIIGESPEPNVFAVKLRVIIENTEGKLAPYEVDVEIAGIFEVNMSIKPEDRSEMADVNGCAVLYGSIRDLVLNLTSRAVNGPLLLPTVNFLDRRKNRSAVSK